MQSHAQSQPPFRKTTQILAPVRYQPAAIGQYDIYPSFDIGPGQIHLGYAALADVIQQHHTVRLDGYGGVLWSDLRQRLEAQLAALGISARWVFIEEALKPPAEVDALIAPFLGGDDPVFGTRFTGALRDFFNEAALERIQSDLHPDLQRNAKSGSTITIVYGCGAALVDAPDSTLIYIDVPKNEIQFRARARVIKNLGAEQALDPKPGYKRFYFVDWPALNAHKATLLPHLDLFVDGQRPEDPTWIRGDDFRAALAQVSRTSFRVRPWFEPGPWGGQWIKQHMPQLSQAVPNYAWSFEAILPENGLTLRSGDLLLEASFDCLMFQAHREVLGEAADAFGFEFPIRFDFLDTFDGGNLSVQCHPRPAYIRQHFGENFTQDETYYILDCAPDAQVYLGFREGVQPAEFRAALERSFLESTPLDVERFINIEPAHKHDLFLIPNGTLHCSGRNTLVLEISATPYIFTFKMYDWLRLDLDGKPRPLNIDRAFDNLYFERQGQRVKDELISKPLVIERGTDWQLVHLPTHPDHFYDVHRIEFAGQFDCDLHNQCHVLSLVEGEAIRVETADGGSQTYSYAETFIMPAAAQRYRLINLGQTPAKVIKAFVKPEFLQNAIRHDVPHISEVTSTGDTP